MGPSGKWIDGIDPDGAVCDAARQTLGARLTAVAHWLPLAAHHASQDVEHVHRLRVSARRAVAALRLYREWLPRKSFGWVKKRLKKIRRRAGEARDLDVLAERISHEARDHAAAILAVVADRRAAAQPAIVRIAEKCRREDRFVRKISTLLDGVRPPDGAEQSATSLTFRSWAQKKLADAAQSFFNDMPFSATTDTAVLHQFRIRGKALRYAIELLAPAFGDELRDEIYPEVEELQGRLGKVQDHVSGIIRLTELREAISDRQLFPLLDHLIQQENARLTQSIADFHKWWTADRAHALERALIALALPPPDDAQSSGRQALPASTEIV